MDHLGQPADPEVRQVIDSALTTIAPTRFARHYLLLGARFVAVGVDTTLLVRAITALATAFGSEQPAPKRDST